MTRRSRDPVVSALTAFALAGLVVLLLVGITGMLVLRRLTDAQALDEARQVTAVGARIVERRVTDDLVEGDADALASVASVVAAAVLHEPVVRVKIWTRDGTVVYSDEAALIGRTFGLGEEEQATLASGEVDAEVSDLSAPENRFERPFGKLLEVYTPIRTPDGTPLLFETYQSFSSVADSQRELLRTFAPVLIVALIAFAVLQIPLAWGLARRVRRAQRDREVYLERAIDASDRERRRIAADLHDGAVQDLAGLAMRMSASANQTEDPGVREAMSDAAGAVRDGIRTLRSAVVGIYPPNLEQAGLAAALSDLTARLPREGLEVVLDVADDTRFGTEIDTLLYRCCQEALRNVEKHAAAVHVEVSVRGQHGRAVLRVADDGRGIDVSRTEEEGHVGLRLLSDLAMDGGGRLSLLPREGGGTVVQVEVPVP
jgi:two-component system NarL family sensor kinase